MAVVAVARATGLLQARRAFAAVLTPAPGRHMAGSVKPATFVAPVSRCATAVAVLVVQYVCACGCPQRRGVRWSPFGCISWRSVLVLLGHRQAGNQCRTARGRRPRRARWRWPQGRPWRACGGPRVACCASSAHHSPISLSASSPQKPQPSAAGPEHGRRLVLQAQPLKLVAGVAAEAMRIHGVVWSASGHGALLACAALADAGPARSRAYVRTRRSPVG